MPIDYMQRPTMVTMIKSVAPGYIAPDIKSRTYLIKSLHYAFALTAKENKWNDADKAVDAFMATWETLPNLGREGSKNIEASFSRAPSFDDAQVNGAPAPNKTARTTHSKTKRSSTQRRSSSTKRSRRSATRRSVSVGGLGLGDYTKYLRQIGGTVIGAMIGTFDSPCNTVLSHVSIALWAVFIYSFMQAMYDNDYNLEEAAKDPTYTNSIADPVQYIIRHVDPSLQARQNELFAKFNAFIANVLDRATRQNLSAANISTIATTIVTGLRKVFYDGPLYNRMIVQPIVCMLAPFMESCNKLCSSEAPGESTL